MHNKKDYIYTILFICVFILGFLMRLKGFVANPSFWHDETALGWNILNKNYSELFGKLRFLQIAPPLFLICSKFSVLIFGGYKHITACDMALRTTPFIFGNLSLILMYFVGKKLFNSKPANLIAVSMIALSPIFVNYGFEFKPYGIDVFCTLAALYIFLSIDLKTDSAKKLLSYGLLLSAMPWFSFAVTFVIAAGLITVCLRDKHFKSVLFLLIPLTISGLLYLNIFVANAYSSNESGMLNSWQGAFVNGNLSNIFSLSIANLKYLFMRLPYFSVFVAIIFILAGLFLFVKDKKYTYIFISIFTLLILIAASIFKFYPYTQRLILFTLPFVILYMAKTADLKNWKISLPIVLFLVTPYLLYSNYFLRIQNLNKHEFSRTLIQIMAENITPNEKIIINEGSNAPFFYYNSFYKLKNKIEYIKTDSKKGETNEQLMNRLEKGHYWVFMVYDYNTEFKNINEIRSWIYKREKIKIYFETRIAQNTLMRIFLN